MRSLLATREYSTLWRLTALLFALLLPVAAWGTVPEIPGDGVDNGASSGTWGSCGAGYASAFVNEAGTLSTGCDLLADAPDQDRDGYTSDGSTGTSGTTYIDCDDTDRRIYPGTQTKGGCSGSDYKSCPTTGGSLSSCTTGPLAEGDTNYYIDCTSGNDANAGTYASPFKTLGKVSGGSGGTGLPASPVTLTQDDFVYIVSGTCNTSFTASIGGASVNALMAFGASGTSGHPITLKQYPGSTATLVQSDGVAIFLDTKHYITVDGVMGSSAWATVTNGASFIQNLNGNNFTAKNIYVSSVSAHGDYNGGCLAVDGTNDFLGHHNFLRNCKRGAGNVENVAAYQMIDDRAAGEGSNNWQRHDVIWSDTYSNSANPSCWFQKHGTQLSDTGANGWRVQYSYCINSRRSFLWEGSGLRAKGIFSYTDSSGYETSTSIQGIARFNDGSFGYHEDNRIEYSTFINQSMLHWHIPITSGTPGLRFKNNVVVDNDTAYSAGNNEGLISVWPAGLDADYTNFLTYLQSNNNIFYNGSTSISIQFMSDTGSGKNTGGNYTFAGWQAIGEDAASYVEDPTHNSQYECASAHCTPTTIGWLAATESAGGGPSIAQLQAAGKKKKKGGH